MYLNRNEISNYPNRRGGLLCYITRSGSIIMGDIRRMKLGTTRSITEATGGREAKILTEPHSVNAYSDLRHSVKLWGTIVD